MTKGAVRAMDTAEDFLQQLGHSKPVRWAATGASKRGWTTWTLAAADYERVIFASPVWLDNLDLVPSARHHYRQSCKNGVSRIRSNIFKMETFNQNFFLNLRIFKILSNVV